MCGIAGIVCFDRFAQVDRARLERMRDVMAHRGPDGDGIVIRGNVGFAHRRLAIVDVAGGAQPMESADKRVVLVHNGEIYNHVALRADLQKRHEYRTRSDTETILHAYEDVGTACVDQLQGMFAFAIWDGEQLMLARDRLGIKPLYYCITNNELVFASEIKAILATGAVTPEANRAVVPEYLATRYVAGRETLFRGIYKLPPAHVLHWSEADGVSERRYWRAHVAEQDLTLDFGEQASALREDLNAAVKRHLMSDVPLGVFLSGGVDSSGLAALVTAASNGPIKTFSVGFDEAGYDERPYARLVANSLGAEHYDVGIGALEFFRELPKLVWHEDGPIAFASSVPLYFVSRLAREHVKVVLTGEGADELFLGYNRYRMAAWNTWLGGAWAEHVPAFARNAVRRMSGIRPLRRYACRTFLGMAPEPRALLCDNFAVFPELLQHGLLRDKDLLADRDPYGKALQSYAAADGDALQRMSTADIETYLVELLKKQDRMSMAASIESRVPFLDDVFVERASKIPSGYKLRGLRAKAVLKAALAELVPSAILHRRKVGFTVPVGRWFRGPGSAIVDDLVLSGRARERGWFDASVLRRLSEEHRSGAVDHGERLWLLAGFELWQRIFIDREVPT